MSLPGRFGDESPREELLKCYRRLENQEIKDNPVNKHHGLTFAIKLKKEILE